MNTFDYVSTDQEETFVKYHRTLRQGLNNANWHFSIWKYLRELTQTYLHELNQAPAFFGLTMQAHYFAALMGINRFFDKQERHLSIRKFLDFAEQNLDIFSNKAFEARMRKQGTFGDRVMEQHTEITSEKVEQDRKKVNDLPVPNIRAWRNKILAHTEAESVRQQINVMREHPVKVKQVDDIINTLDDILNDYHRAYEAGTWLKDLSFETGLQWVMDSIRFKIERDREIRGERT